MVQTFERSLYLTTQLAELDIPMVIAINMMDDVRKSGDKINIKQLSEEIGCDVLKSQHLRAKVLRKYQLKQLKLLKIQALQQSTNIVLLLNIL